MTINISRNYNFNISKTALTLIIKEFSNPEIRPIILKKVKFDSMHKIYSIPSLSDILYLKNDLWWSESEYHMILQNAQMELKILVQKNPRINIIDARNLLYQPNNIIFENYFTR
jgi:hypothetical protein